MVVVLCSTGQRARGLDRVRMVFKYTKPHRPANRPSGLNLGLVVAPDLDFATAGAIQGDFS